MKSLLVQLVFNDICFVKKELIAQTVTTIIFIYLLAYTLIYWGSTGNVMVLDKENGNGQPCSNSRGEYVYSHFVLMTLGKEQLYHFTPPLVVIYLVWHTALGLLIVPAVPS